MGYCSLKEQFTVFQRIYSVVVGPAEAKRVVDFWIRELDNMRDVLNMDWNSVHGLAQHAR